MREKTMKFLLVVMFSCLPLMVIADEVVLKSGKVLEGKILSETAKKVKIEVVIGKSRAVMTVDRKEIEKITRGVLPNDEFVKRLGELDPADLQGHKDLMAWAHDKKLFQQEKLILSRIPAVEVASRKKANPHKWCRECDASGTASCKGCVGKGKSSTPCGKCAGSGTGLKCVTCTKAEDSLLDCRRCGGEGTYERFDPLEGRKVKTRCRDCSGKGKILCPICKGKKARSCEDCKGEGAFLKTCEECEGKKQFSCKPCSGSGIVGDNANSKQKKADAEEEKRKKEKEKKKPVIEADPFG